MGVIIFTKYNLIDLNTKKIHHFNLLLIKNRERTSTTLECYDVMMLCTSHCLIFKFGRTTCTRRESFLPFPYHPSW